MAKNRLFIGTQWTDPQRGLDNSVNTTAEVSRACKDDPKTYLLVPLFLSSAEKKRYFCFLPQGRCLLTGYYHESFIWSYLTDLFRR